MPEHAAPPLASICILAKTPTWLASCIDSALAQTTPPPEVIVVDWSASSEVETICSARTGIRHLHAANSDDALVMAIANSHGRYVRLVRDCDLLAPDAMAPLVAAIQQAPETRMAFALAMQIDAEGKQLGVDQKIQFSRTPQLLNGNALVQQLAQTCTNLIGPLTNALFNGPWLRGLGDRVFNGKQPGSRYTELRDLTCYCKAAADRPVAFVPSVLSSCRNTSPSADTLAALTEWRALIDEILPPRPQHASARSQAIRAFNNRLSEFASTHDAARTAAMQLRFLDADNPDFADYQHCRALLETGQLKDALPLLLALAEKQTSCWQVYEALADIALARHDDRTALAYLESAAHKAITPGPVTLKLATLLIGTFRLDEGRTQLRRYLASHPEDHQAQTLLDSTDIHKTAPAENDIDASTLSAYACLTGDYANWAAASASRPPPTDGKFIFEFIILVAGDSAPRLADTIDAIAAQQTGQWHLSVVAEFAAPDPSLSESALVSWFVCDTPGTFAPQLTQAVSQSGADWLVISSAGTCFAPDYLGHLTAHIQRHPQQDLAYTDDDHIDPSGNRCLPRFKPDFDPDYCHAFDYIRDIAVRREVLASLDPTTLVSGAETYDIVLRVFDRRGSEAIGHLDHVLVHIPLPLTHRTTPTGGIAALTDHFKRTEASVAIEPGTFTYLRQVSYQNKKTPLVSLIVCVIESSLHLDNCIDNLFRHTTYPAWELIVVHRSGDAEALACERKFTERPGNTCRWIAADGANGLATLANAAAGAARGDYLLLLDPRTEPIADDWLDLMMAHAQRTEIGVTGARLISPERNRMIHGGLVLGMEGGATGVFPDLTAEQPGYLFRAVTEQRYSAVSAVCMLVRRADYLSVGGMEKSYKLHYADVDLCLKLRQRGLATLWLPEPAMVLHPASKSDQEAGAEIPDAYQLFQQWPTWLANDPAWNRNLSLSAPQPVIEHELLMPYGATEADYEGAIIGMPIGPPSVVEYRVAAPLRALDAAMQASCLSIGLRNHDAANSSRLPRVPTPVELARLQARALLIHIPVDDARLIALLHYRELNPDVLRIYSLDDLVTDIPPDNPTGLNLPPLVLAERLRIGAGACQRGIVSTEPLAALLRPYIADVRVVPNMLERSRWGMLAAQRRNGKRPRIGWAGAQQHAGDLRFILDVVAATHREVDWIFFGMMPEGAERLVAEFHPYVRDFDAYPAKLATLDLDLAIAPLVLHPFNEAKSNLRLLEYGILGWPVICTDIFPYRTNDPPVTRLANDAGAWIAAVREKIADRASLTREGDALRQWVLDNYILEDHLDRWLDALRPSP